MHLSGIGVGDPFGVNPVIGLAVFRIIDLLGWVDRWVEVREETTGRRLAVVDGEGISIVGAGDRGQDVRQETKRVEDTYLITRV